MNGKFNIDWQNVAVVITVVAMAVLFITGLWVGKG